MPCLTAGFYLIRGDKVMPELTNDREARIVDAAAECESEESLARVACGILELLAQRGSSAWEALGRQIAASGQKDELMHQAAAMVADLEIEELEEELGEDDETDERLDPEDGIIETGEEIDEAEDA